MLKHQIIQFVGMALIGIAFNPMNLLAYRFNDLYMSLTLLYGGLVMAANMVWSHEVIHYITMGHCNMTYFIGGIVLVIGLTILLLRNQLCVDDTQYLRRMISHHSTALTTSYKIQNKTKDKELHKLATDIIDTQEKEIKQMKEMLQK